MSDWMLPRELSPREEHDLLIALENDYPGRVTTIYSTKTHRLIGFGIPSLDAFFLAVEVGRIRRADTGK